jgi:hypothetical protein
MASVSRIRVMISLLVNASPGLETANQPTVNASRGRGMASLLMESASRGRGMRSPAIGPRDPHVMASESRIRVMASLLMASVSRGRVMLSLAIGRHDRLAMASGSRIRVTASLLASANLIPATVSLLVNASPGRAMENLLMASVSRGLAMPSPAIDPHDLPEMVNVSPGRVTASPALTAVAAIVHAETLKRIR